MEFVLDDEKMNEKGENSILGPKKLKDAMERMKLLESKGDGTTEETGMWGTDSDGLDMRERGIRPQ